MEGRATPRLLLRKRPGGSATAEGRAFGCRAPRGRQTCRRKPLVSVSGWMRLISGLSEPSRGGTLKGPVLSRRPARGPWLCVQAPCRVGNRKVTNRPMRGNAEGFSEVTLEEVST